VNRVGGTDFVVSQGRESIGGATCLWVVRMVPRPLCRLYRADQGVGRLPPFSGRLLTRQDEATDACATVAEFPIKPCFPELRGVRLNVGFGERIGLGKWLMRSAA
jgi:hypothetical protein